MVMVGWGENGIDLDSVEMESAVGWEVTLCESFFPNQPIFQPVWPIFSVLCLL